VEFVEEYREANTEGRRQLFAKDILPALKKLHPHLDCDRWKKMKDDAKRWYQNTARRRSVRERFRLTSNVSLRKVICSTKKAQIEEAVRDLSGCEPGSKGYLGFYSKGLEQVMKHLDRTEKAKLEGMRVDWIQKAYPEDVQRRCVSQRWPRRHRRVRRVELSFWQNV
jgi:hypothetical protein